MEKKIGYINCGLLNLFALVSARFIDPGFTFVERGSAFLVAGFAVLIINGFYMWQKRYKQQKIDRDVDRIRRQKDREAKEADRINAKLTKEKAKGEMLFTPGDIAVTEVEDKAATSNSTSVPVAPVRKEALSRPKVPTFAEDLADSEGAKLVRESLRKGGKSHE